MKQQILTLLLLFISVPLLADTGKCPLCPQNIKATLSDDGNKVTVTWDAVTHTEDGSEIDKSKLTYYIFDAYGTIIDPYLAKTTECTYTFDYTDIKEQDFKAYEITAGVGDLYSESMVAYSNIVIVGPAYELPWTESFPEGKAQQTLWGLSDNTTKTCFYKIMKDGDWGDLITSQDNDGGFFLMMPTTDGDQFGMYSGKVDISKAEKPKLEFYYKGRSGVLEITPFAKIDLSQNKDDWQLCEIDLEAYKSKGSIQFKLNYVSDNASAETKAVAIDNIRIYDANGTAIIDQGSSKYPTPENLKAEVEGENVTLSWDAIDMADLTSTKARTEDFESADYSTFTIYDFGGWTLYDGDKSSEYKITTIPNNSYAGYQKSWQLSQFDRSGLDENFRPDFVGPDNSQGILISYSAADGKTDNWLISPELTGKAQTISFAIKSFSIAYGNETFEVLYSTKSKDAADFVKLDDPNNFDTKGIGEEWTDCKFALPEGAKYFAIRHTSNNNWALMLDNISFVQASVLPEGTTLLGYNITRDGVKLNEEPLTATSYTEILPAAPGKYKYKVAAVYSVGQSKYSAAVEAEVKGSTTIRNTFAPASAANDAIYNLQGQRVNAASKRGVYIVNGRKLLK